VAGTKVEAVLEGVDDGSDDRSYAQSELNQRRLEGIETVAFISGELNQDSLLAERLGNTGLEEEEESPS
jgi:hypothetical protein